MTGFTVESVRSSTPREFATLVKGVKDADIRTAMAGPERADLLDAVFAKFPELFVPEKAAGVDARIDIRVTGGPGDSSDTYAIVVRDSTCTVEKAPTVEPTVSLMMAPVEFLKIITRSGNPVMMAMTGKLKVRGDLALAQRFGDYFDVRRG